MDSNAAPAADRLSHVGQLYVTTVAVAALLTLRADSQAAYVALVVLALPLSLLALWVGFYAALAAGFVFGYDAVEFSWPAALVWVAVWTTTAWINARMAQAVLLRGWGAVRGPGDPAWTGSDEI